MRAKSDVRNPGYLKALWRNRKSSYMRMRALITGDTNDALKRYWGS